MNQTMFGKPPTKGEYLCTKCDMSFGFDDGDMLRCPLCNDRRRDDLVLIYVREVPEELMMYMSCDYNAG